MQLQGHNFSSDMSAFRRAIPKQKNGYLYALDDELKELIGKTGDSEIRVAAIKLARLIESELQVRDDIAHLPSNNPIQ
ncbi:hypothetical protein HAP94_07210 [Acidithiobacillus ferrivorans]|nr:hypothetical protein [Acidithiobacillus ferrivorans]